MSVLDELRGRRGVFITCPHCDRSFPASKGQLFDATRPLSPAARAKLEEVALEVQGARTSHLEDVRRSKDRVKTAARVVNIGKVVEKIAPSLQGFPANAGDCRSLFEPIDYIVFRGASKGQIDSVAFVDVKSGQSRLNERQRAIRVAVEKGRVTVHLAEPNVGREPT